MLKSLRSISGSTSTGIPPPMTGTLGLVTVIGAHDPVVGSAVVSCPSVVMTMSPAITPPTATAHATRTPASPRAVVSWQPS